MSMIKPLIISKKTKFTILDTIIPSYEKSFKSINIFIDVRTILSGLFQKEFASYIPTMRESENLFLCAELINIAAHYRLYFWNKRRMNSNIFFFYSGKASTRCLELDGDYKQDYLQRHGKNGEFPDVSNYVDSNLELFATMATRLPYIFYINSQTLDPNVVPSLIMKNEEFKDNVNLVLSNSIPMLQYINYPKTNVMTLKGDKSKVISPSTIYDGLVKTSPCLDNLNFDSRLIIPILSISKDAKSGVIGWDKYAYIKAIKFFIDQVNKGIFTPKLEYNCKTFVSTLKKCKRVTDEQIDIAHVNYLIHSVYDNLLDMTDKEEIIINEQLVQLIDLDAVYEVNHRCFRENPISLGYVVAGEEVSEDEEELFN